MAIHRKEGITGQKKHWTRALDGGDKNGVHQREKLSVEIYKQFMGI